VQKLIFVLSRFTLGLVGSNRSQRRGLRAEMRSRRVARCSATILLNTSVQAKLRFSVAPV
jgi:hypothetical protein